MEILTNYELSKRLAKLQKDVCCNSGGGSLQDILSDDAVLTEDNNIDGGGNQLRLTNVPLRISDGKEPIGSRFSYPWNTNPFTSWADATATTTITTDGTTTTFAGGNNDLLSSISQSFYIGVSEWTMHQRIKVKAKSATSYGFGIKIKPGNSSASLMFIHFLLASTTGYIAYTSFDTLPDGSSLSNQNKPLFVWAVDDILDISLVRRNRELTVRMVNLTNNMVSELIVPGFDVAVGQLNVYFYGGTWEFQDSFDLTYDGIQSPTVAFMGDSVTSGAGAQVGNDLAFRYADVASQGIKGSTEVMAAGFENTQDGIYRVTDTIDWVKPEILIIAYGLNDRNIINNATTFENNYRSIIASVLGSATPPAHIILSYIIPCTTNDVTSYNTIIQDIADDNGLETIDVFSLLKDPANTHLAAIYTGDYDTLHPNRLGHFIIGNAIRTKLIKESLVVIESPEQFDDVPLTQNPKLTLGLDNDNRLVSYYDGLDDNSIKNRKSTNTISDAQDASIFISGDITNKGNVTFVGSGNLAAPLFKLDSLAGTITMGNTNIDGVFNIASGTATLLQNYIVFANNTFMFSNGGVMKLMCNNPAGNGLARGTVISNFPNVPTVYHIIDFEIDTGSGSVVKAFINKDGGAMFGDTTIQDCAMVEVKSTTKGLLLPRMTKTQRDTIATPVAGLAVYQTDNTPGLRVYNGTNWIKYIETTD